MGFSFRAFINLCDQDISNKIEVLINNPNFAFFFKKGKDVFAATEESRIMFANMKKPDPDMPKGWKKDANFMAYNLSKMIKGESSYKEIISYTDIKQVKIMDTDEITTYLKGDV